MKPCLLTVDRFIRRSRRFVTTTEIIRACPTVNPSARISELRAMNLLETRKEPTFPYKAKYRALPKKVATA